MSSMEEAGFLSEQIKQYIDQHRQQNLSLFKLCEDINRFTHSTLLTIDVRNRELTKMAVTCLFIKTMSTFQGIVLMTERGMENEAKISLRCLLECRFSIVAIKEDNNLVERLALEDDQYRRLKALKSYKKNMDLGTTTFPPTPSKEEVETLIDQLKKKIKEEKLKEVPIWKLAEIASLSEVYNSAYCYLSGTIHVDFSDLEKYLKINSSDRVETFLWGPDGKDINWILLISTESILNVLEAIRDVFSLSYDDVWKEMKSRYLAMNKGFSENQ